MPAEHNRVRKSQLGESGIRESILLNVHGNERDCLLRTGTGGGEGGGGGGGGGEE